MMAEVKMDVRSPRLQRWVLAYVAVFFFICMIPSISASADFPSLSVLRTQTPPSTQEEAVIGLIKRKVADRYVDFKVNVQPALSSGDTDAFQIEATGGHVTLTGTSGVAAAMAFYYYTKTYCGCHTSWAGDQFRLPAVLPDIPAPGIHRTVNDRFRYYQNVCTVSYSSPWWDWARWEREIDWMALQGINLPLAFTAQEAIWQRVFQQMGFTQAEIDDFFGGPAFLAWSRMGNIQGWGGPLPPSWHEQQINLQHQILQRMREFSIIPVLPAFAGHVPRNTTRVFPKANVTHNAGWCNFNATYSQVTLLQFSDPLFVQFGKAFLTEYIKEFGSNHIYSADTFNEMTPSSGDPGYLTAAGKAVFNSMTAADPDAVWLMQAWLFLEAFWTETRVKALVTSVPIGRMLLLDLYSDVEPLYGKFNSYYGQPFIWCMLHDFGGTIAMYGNLPVYNEGPFKGRNNSTMVGIGLTPEGINQNDVVYEFMMENAWRTEPRGNISQWLVDYSKQRYGAYNEHAAQAWLLLQKTVYSISSDTGHGHGHNLITFQRPSLNKQPDVWYNVSLMLEAASRIMAASPDLSDSSLFRYDMVDVMRQSMQLTSTFYYKDLQDAYKKKDLDAFIAASTNLLSELKLMDILLETDDHFLLGNWLESAKALATNDAERALYEYNARNQITVWGPDANILDYANKQWNGLMRDYYHARWELFVEEVQDALMNNATFSQAKFNADVYAKVEQPFTFSRKVYPSKATNNTMMVVGSIWNRLQARLKRLAQHQETLMLNVDAVTSPVFTHTKYSQSIHQLEN